MFHWVRRSLWRRGPRALIARLVREIRSHPAEPVLDGELSGEHDGCVEGHGGTGARGSDRGLSRCPVVAVYSLDIDDYDPDAERLELTHRPATDTALKNG